MILPRKYDHGHAIVIGGSNMLVRKLCIDKARCIRREVITLRPALTVSRLPTPSHKRTCRRIAHLQTGKETSARQGRPLKHSSTASVPYEGLLFLPRATVAIFDHHSRQILGSCAVCRDIFAKGSSLLSRFRLPFWAALCEKE